MSDDRPETDEPPAAGIVDRPGVLPRSGPDRFRDPTIPSFADRLRLAEIQSSPIVDFTGPGDFCGFELPQPGPYHESPFGVPLDPPAFRPDPVGPMSGWERDDPPGWSGVERRQTSGPFANKLPAVPGYEILAELGRGAMGVVYKARQHRLNRTVALKMILAAHYAGTDAILRFLSEAEIIARLQHPNIVQIHATGDFDGRPYVELEYVEGGSLAARIDGTPWPPRAAAELIESLACGMAEAHRMGIVHRDLKPANVLMMHDGTAKITDFGLAKSIANDSGLTQHESILGSPNYMSPEQADGRAKEVGRSADVYALGAILYELITGRPPFVAPTILATLDLVKHAEPVAPSRLQPGVPSDLETICLKCLQKDPNDRYGSAEPLAEDVARYLNGEPILARPTPHWERAWKWVRRHPTIAALVVVSTVLVTAAVAAGLWYKSDIERRQAVVRSRLDEVETQVNRLVLLGNDAIRRSDWDGAKTHFSSGLELIRVEPGLNNMNTSVARQLAITNQKIAEREAHAASRRRLSEFRKAYDEAAFYQSQFTGLDPEANLELTRASARRAIELFQPNQPPATGLALAKGDFSQEETELLCDRYYELGLILAQATSQPVKGEVAATQARHALEILDRIERVRSPTKLFPTRRAAYLEQAGDQAAAKHLRQIAETVHQSGSSSVDDLLEAEDAYLGRDYKRAVPALRRLIARQPDHFWGQYMLAICHLKEHRAAEAQVALSACQARRPDFVWTHLLKGFAEGEMGEFDLRARTRRTGALRHARQSRCHARSPRTEPGRRR
jgi:tRNA A-37 threonylcarbamoyl transferase component Bud32